MFVRVSDRRNTQRVEGIDNDTTIQQMKKIVCWALDKKEQMAEGVELKLGGKQLDNDATLGGCGVQVNSLILADFGNQTVDCGEAIKKPLNMVKYWPNPTVANIREIKSFVIEEASLLFEGLGGGIEIAVPERFRWEQLTWQISYLSESTSIPQTHFKIPLSNPHDSYITLAPLIVNRHIWTSESSADDSFISLTFAERAALTYACCISPLFNRIPQDIYEAICDFLPPTAHVEVCSALFLNRVFITNVFWGIMNLFFFPCWCCFYIMSGILCLLWFIVFYCHRITPSSGTANVKMKQTDSSS